MIEKHPTTLVGTTPRSVEAAFRVLGRGGKARALRIARKAQDALAQAGQAPSDGIDRLVKQIEVAEHDEQVVGPLEAIGLRVCERLKGMLKEAKKDGIDFARALEESVIAEEKLEAVELHAAKAEEKELAKLEAEQAAAAAKAAEDEKARKASDLAKAAARQKKLAEDEAAAKALAKADAKKGTATPTPPPAPPAS